MEPLSIPSSISVFVDLLCPTGYLVSNEASSGDHVTNCSIGFFVTPPCYGHTIPLQVWLSDGE